MSTIELRSSYPLTKKDVMDIIGITSATTLWGYERFLDAKDVTRVGRYKRYASGVPNKILKGLNKEQN